MRKYTGWLVLGLAATLGIVGLAAGTAAAQQGGDDDEGDVGPGRGRMALIRAALDLTDDQVATMREEFLAFRTDSRALRDQMKEQAKKIPDLVRSSGLRESDLMAVHDQVHDLAGQLGEKRVQMLYRMWQKLTPEQREKLGGLIEEHVDDGFGFGFMGGGHGRGHHGRGGPDEAGRADRPGRGAAAGQAGRPERAARAGRGPSSL